MFLPQLNSLDQNLLPQVINLTQIKICSSWNKSTAFYVLVYGKHYFASRNQKRGYFLLESKTEDTEQQGSVAASEVSSWTS